MRENNKYLTGGGRLNSICKIDKKKFTNDQLKMLIDNKILNFVTASADGQPHCVIVEPSRFENDKIIIPVVQMETSKKNVEENQKVFMHVFIDKGLADSIQLKINGHTEIVKNGSLFEEIKHFEESERLPEGLYVNSVFIVYPTKIETTVG